MARLPPSRTALRALFARSGNLCAFPGCTHELVNAKHQFIAQIAHIEAAEPGGPRHNPSQDDEQRRSVENLMILCHRHHVETDDVEEYPVQRLREMKATHGAAHGKKLFKVDESVIFQLESQMAKYWADVERINKQEHVIPDLAVGIDVSQSPKELFDGLYGALTELGQRTDWLREWDSTLGDELRAFLIKLGYDPAAYDAVPYYENPFVNRSWETHNLAIRNGFSDLWVRMRQVEVRFLEEYLKTHPSDGAAELRFKDAKTRLLEMARSAGYAD